VQDCFEFIGNVKDQRKHGLYVDSPFPGPGDKYTHKFNRADHERLARGLGEFQQTRIVARYYDDPMVRELYPEDRWQWIRFDGRDRANNDKKPEVLLVSSAGQRDLF
jgi:hypothetical protein